MNNTDDKNLKIIGIRRAGMGVGGYCRCPFCGTRKEHQRGIPCDTIKCPKCGALMIREA